MPLVQKSTYRRSRIFINGHIETIAPVLLRNVQGVAYERERLTTSDGDFVDLDWMDNGKKRLIILTHGLEGDTSRQYMLGMAKIFYKNGWDVLAWNCRSCSGEMNKAKRMYHHGDVADIGEVVQHALSRKNYETVALSGFSMGANISLKFLGVQGKAIPEQVKAAVVFSAPTDLQAGAEILDNFENTIYKKRFLYYLKQKMEVKSKQYPEVIDMENFKRVKVWRDFDEYFSVPINDFKNAADFYEKASAKNYMHGIAVPTLLVQAKNDPILPPVCFPTNLCQTHKFIHLEMPEHGGHVGFWRHNQEFAWSEERAIDFVKSLGIK